MAEQNAIKMRRDDCGAVGYMAHWDFEWFQAEGIKRFSRLYLQKTDALGLRYHWYGGDQRD